MTDVATFTVPAYVLWPATACLWGLAVLLLVTAIRAAMETPILLRHLARNEWIQGHMKTHVAAVMAAHTAKETDHDIP